MHQSTPQFYDVQKAVIYSFDLMFQTWSLHCGSLELRNVRILRNNEPVNAW